MDSHGGAHFRNSLLSSFAPSELDRLGRHLQPVSFVMHQTLHEPGNTIDDVYFPESGLISHTADTRDRGLVEIGITGREGFVGAAVLLNAEARAAHRAFVQVPGTGYRLRASLCRQAALQSPTVRDRCLRYVQFSMMQTAQIAACNARHDLPERLARWLVMSHDRIDGDILPMKQEFLSFMLGVRRAGVSMVANTLQSAGLIRQARGHIVVLDRARLEDEACSCYGLIEESRRQILGGDW